MSDINTVTPSILFCFGIFPILSFSTLCALCFRYVLKMSYNEMFKHLCHKICFETKFIPFRIILEFISTTSFILSIFRSYCFCFFFFLVFKILTCFSFTLFLLSSICRLYTLFLFLLENLVFRFPESFIYLFFLLTLSSYI